ncbi:hypothetical protein AC1031_006954 [Aphanomyces cochlioides]|nr:hypothetical protein AC1031_006954 [Aphanomyces cochlioides]
MSAAAVKAEASDSHLLVPIPPPRYRFQKVTLPSVNTNTAPLRYKVDAKPVILGDIDLTVPVPPTRWALQVLAKHRNQTITSQFSFANRKNEILTVPPPQRTSPSTLKNRSCNAENDVDLAIANMKIEEVPRGRMSQHALPFMMKEQSMKQEPGVISIAVSKRPLPDDMDVDIFQSKRRISINDDKYLAWPARFNISDEIMVALFAAPLCGPVLTNCRVNSCMTPHKVDSLSVELPAIDIPHAFSTLKHCLLPESDLTQEVDEKFVHVRRRLHLRCEIATRTAFEALLRDKPKILHCMCHVSEEALFLEDLEGRTSSMPWSELKRYLTVKSPTLFVILSQNPKAGAKVAEFGAPHVVWIDISQSVEHATFVTHFYSLLQLGETLHDSFEGARQLVGEKMCALLPRHANHNIVILPAKTVSTENLAADIWPRRERVNFPALASFVGFPHLPSELFGRAQEMIFLFEHLASPSIRLVSIDGSRGSGKTTLAVAIAQYLHLRNRVKAIYISVAATIPHAYASSYLNMIAH